jgi:hypothetical protein
MKKEILNEINDMRIKMGLKVLNEESILLSESIVGILEKTVVKSLRDLEKGLIKKFITGRLSDVEKNELKLFLKGDEGKEFISSLKAAVNDETDFGKKMVYNNWIKNRLEKFAASEIKQAVPSSLSGKGSVRGKDTNPFANIDNQLSRSEITTLETPKDKNFVLNNLRKASPVFRLFEQTVDSLPGLKDSEKELLKLGYTKYSNFTESELVKIIQELRMQVAAPYKRILYNIGKSPLKSAKWLAMASLAVLLIKFTFQGGKVVNKGGEKALEYLSSTMSGIKNDKETLIEFIKGIPELKGFGPDDEPFLTQKPNGVWEFKGGDNKIYRFEYKEDHFEQIK